MTKILTDCVPFLFNVISMITNMLILQCTFLSQALVFLAVNPVQYESVCSL
jgi:hypothetical protein